MEDVVAEDQGDRLVADEVGADDERLRDALRAGLDGVSSRIPSGAVTEQPLELGLVLRRW